MLLAVAVARPRCVGFFVSVDHPIGFVAGALGIVQAPAHARHRIEPFHVARLEPLRLLARRAARVRPAPARRHGRPRLAGRLPPVRQDDRGARALAFGRARRAQRDGRSSASCCSSARASLGLAAVARRRGAPLLPAALFASGVYFAVHTAIDWVWSIPSVGLAGLVLVGIGASRGTRPVLGSRPALAGAGARRRRRAGRLPPALALRPVHGQRVRRERLGAREQPRRGRRTLDPLSVDPLLTQAALAASPNDIPPLRAAVELQPGDSEVHYLLGVAVPERAPPCRRAPPARDRAEPVSARRRRSRTRSAARAAAVNV